MLSPNKGQALTELAIFGSILLFCLSVLIQYGLEANYQQQVQMEAFRKAQKIAFYKSGPNSSTSLVLLKDKPLPDPRDQWGYAERYPIAAGANAVWDTNLSANYVKKFVDTPNDRDLPAVYFEIDKGDTAGAFNAGAQRVPAQANENNVFGFYAARFEKRPCPETITVVFEDPEHDNPDNVAKTEYYGVTVNREDVKIMRTEGVFSAPQDVQKDYELLMYPYFRYNGLKRRILWADVDQNDGGKLEYIIAADQNKMLFYLDNHGPQIPIDTERATIYPEDNIYAWGEGRRRPARPQDKQGLIEDFDKSMQHQGSRVTKNQNGASIISATALNATQRITHKIRLNDGRILDIPAEFTVNRADLYNWR